MTSCQSLAVSYRSSRTRKVLEKRSTERYSFAIFPFVLRLPRLLKQNVSRVASAFTSLISRPPKVNHMGNTFEILRKRQPSFGLRRGQHRLGRNCAHNFCKLAQY